MKVTRVAATRSVSGNSATTGQRAQESPRSQRPPSAVSSASVEVVESRRAPVEYRGAACSVPTCLTELAREWLRSSLKFSWDRAVYLYLSQIAATWQQFLGDEQFQQGLRSVEAMSLSLANPNVHQILVTAYISATRCFSWLPWHHS